MHYGISFFKCDYTYFVVTFHDRSNGCFIVYIKYDSTLQINWNWHMYESFLFIDICICDCHFVEGPANKIMVISCIYRPTGATQWSILPAQID